MRERMRGSYFQDPDIKRDLCDIKGWKGFPFILKN
jgi:hypothetical protein